MRASFLFPICQPTDRIAFMLQDELNTEPAPKIFLQNKLNRAQLKLTELEYILFPKGAMIETHVDL